MTKKNIEISLLQDLDIDEVIRFYNSIYKSTRTREKFDWEFKDAAAGKAIYVIAKDTNTKKIVGTQCAIPIELITTGGKTILTAKSEDTLVDPAYRGLNIFENMYKLLFEECKKSRITYLWGFTSAKKPFLKLGFSIPYDHSQSLKVFDILPSYKYLSGLNATNTTGAKIKIMLLCGIARGVTLKNYFFSGDDLIQDFETTVKSKVQTIDNSELQKSLVNNHFAIKQNADYLNWRVKNNPYHEKIVSVTFSSKAHEVANIIFNEHKPGIWYLLNDVYTQELSQKQKVAMLHRSIKLLQYQENREVDLIRAMDFSHNDYAIKEMQQRKNIGFVHLDRGISFVWISLDEQNTLNAKDFILSRIATQGIV